LKVEGMLVVDFVAHADWGIGPRKRWIAKARLETDGQYRVSIPELVTEPGELLSEVWSEFDPEKLCLLGFDFPIGLPLAYAQKAGIRDFRVALSQFGRGMWSDFYRVAEQPDQIKLERPFYPLRPGKSKQEHLLQALGIEGISALRRRCEQGYHFQDSNGIFHHRRPASPLFWTMGGQQVGKAAILGWEKVLAPCFRNGPPSIFLWPFDGNFMDLLDQTRTIIVESYPAEYYERLGIRYHRTGQNRGGKRSQASRAAQAYPIFEWCSANRVELAEGLIGWLHAGFGSSPVGEDPFDSLIGLLGMISCLRDPSQIFEPVDAGIRQIEGWIFGMPEI
jgi:hypothetical protein